jgi:hypothetical protein
MFRWSERLGASILSVLMGCAAAAPATDTFPLPSTSPAGLVRPITSEALTSGRFVAFSDYWSVPLPSGDPVRFLADGGVVNERAGLAGTWTILNDSTVRIGGAVFRHNAATGDLFSPALTDFPLDSLPPGVRPLGTRIMVEPR